MTRDEWKKLLDTYKTVKETVDESLEGIVDHLETPCNKGKTQTVAVQGAGRRGLPPFAQEPVVCDRGSRGCDLEHRDLEALVFARMALERVKALSEKTKTPVV